jgi:hypothetical protein
MAPEPDLLEPLFRLAVIKTVAEIRVTLFDCAQVFESL